MLIIIDPQYESNNDTEALSKIGSEDDETLVAT